MAAGKVCTGFSKPYVAIYNAAAGVITYTQGRQLARGVNVSIAPDVSDNNRFHADNVVAETEAGTFTGGTLTLTVDGLFKPSEKLIMGLPDNDANGFTAYGDAQNSPNVGAGFVARYMSDGITTYVPIVIAKVKFNQISTNAATQEDQIDWQTQELTATIMRGDDSNHNWKFVGADFSTEEEAELALQTKLGIYVTNPALSPVGAGVTLFGQLVGDMQSGVVIEDGRITGTLAYIDDGALATDWGAGNFIAIQFSNIDSRATSVRVGLQPSESSGLVEIINDPDKNGVFKITDKTAQKFVVISSDGEHTETTSYDLTGLTLES